MADEEVKRKGETLIGIDQRMVNQEDLSQIETEVMSLEMIEESKGVLDAAKRDTSKEIAWQKMSIYTERRKQKKTLM